MHYLGNADCTLFDRASFRNLESKDDKRFDLPSDLQMDLRDRDYYDVVAFSPLPFLP